MDFPFQPLIRDDEGTIRFRRNDLVRFLLDAGPFNMNILAALPNISDDDRMQFAQLIGYSVSGYGELSYVSEDAVAKADRMADLISVVV